MNSIILRGPRVIMRPVELKDASTFCKWFDDKQVVKYLLRQKGFTLKEEIGLLRKMRKAVDKVCLSIINEKGKLIGNTQIKIFPEHKRAEFGIVIGEKSEWGKGYAGEVLSLWQEYVFGKLKYERLELGVHMNNERAIRAYTKAGFRPEGVRRNYCWNAVTRQMEDDGIMAILKNEWKQIINK